MIDLDKNPNLEERFWMDANDVKELERANGYLPENLTIECHCVANSKTYVKYNMNFMAFPYTTQTERINWNDCLKLKSNTYYAKRNIFQSNDKKRVLNLDLNALPKHFEYLDLYFLSEEAVTENFFILFYLESKNIPILAYNKSFLAYWYGAKLCTFAKIEDKWRLYPIFQGSASSPIELLEERTKGKV